MSSDPISRCFSTSIYTTKLMTARSRVQKDLSVEAYQLSDFDEDGQSWSEENYPGGFTSYASRNDLHFISSTFHALQEMIDPHVESFAKSLDYDLSGVGLHMTDCWINIMGPGCVHTSHIHPLSFISGTYYVKVPKGSSGIRFEDPRLSNFMAAPPKKAKAKRENQQFITVPSAVGKLVLFESWLRHEVPAHLCNEERISVSFNYGWEPESFDESGE